MANPPPYNREYSFSDYQANNPSQPLPGPQVDAELENIEAAINGTISALGDVRRADGALPNRIVTADALADALVLGLETPVAWETGARYSAPDTVFVDTNPIQGIYRCVVSHDSSVFTDDLAAGFWELIFSLSEAGLSAVALSGQYEDLQGKPEIVAGVGIDVDVNGQEVKITNTGDGSGDMLKEAYDTGGYGADVFGGGVRFATKAMAEAWHPDVAPTYIEIAGRDSANDGRGGRFAYHGTSAPSHIRWIKVTLADGVTDAYYVSTRPVYVILSTGQSNMGIAGAVPGYNKPNNVYQWNLGNPDDNPLGDAFVDGGGSWAAIGLSYGGEYARAHPEADVYVINVARHSYSIVQWLPEPPTGLDMFAITDANVTAALAQIGAARINRFLWWQGEGDWNSTTYVTDWITLYARYLGKNWFGGWSTPVTLFGVSTYGTPSLGNMFNKNLTEIAAVFPNVITYFHTSIGFSDSWDPTDDYVHILVSAIPEKARLAYEAKAYRAAWSDPYYKTEMASGFWAGRRSPIPTDKGAGVLVGNDGSLSVFSNGVEPHSVLPIYNNADTPGSDPVLVGVLYSHGSKLAFTATGVFGIEAAICELPAVTKFPGSFVSAANDGDAAASGVPVGGLYRNGSVVQIRTV